MSKEDIERRLTTILAADVVGYSQLMGADEAGTLAQLKTHRKELLDPKAIQHHGRVVKLMGDGALMEFASVVDAVRFAVEVQQIMAARNANAPAEPQIVYRIGINIGDIIVDGQDIYGDGVNIAARLENLCEAGGICISRNVFNQVKGKLDLTFEHLGEKTVKNIAEPVSAYRVVPDDKAAALVTPVVQQTARWMGQRSVIAASLTGLLVLVAGGFAWWRPLAPRVEPAALERMAHPLPDKPSIAVLPFSNMSANADQQYFADGITEDLITDLSKISGLFVIARNSSFAYRDKPVKIRQVAEELGVRYVLKGSIRRAADKVRINVQLVDATNGGHLWADRYDGGMRDIFGLQDKVTKQVVSALAVKLTLVERAARKPGTVSTDAYDAFLRGWSHYRHNTPADFAKAIPYLKRAIALDPNYSRAYAALAALYWAVIDKYETTGESGWLSKMGITPFDALRLERKYLGLAMTDPVPLAHQVASGRLSRRAQHEAAIAEATRAISLDPNDPVSHEAMAIALIYGGRPREAIVSVRRAMRFDPQSAHEYLFWLGLAQFGAEQFESAENTLMTAYQKKPEDDLILILMAATYGHLGRLKEANLAIDTANGLRKARRERLQRAELRLGIDAYMVGPYTLKDVDRWPYKLKADRARLREGLRLAGVPEKGNGDNESPTEVAGATTVDPAAAKKLHDGAAVFVDVRGESRWKDGHIPGSINLPLTDKIFTEPELSKFAAKDRELVFYCSGTRCLRSSKACKKAIEWGYKKVYYFRDGFPGWKAASYPIATKGIPARARVIKQ